MQGDALTRFLISQPTEFRFGQFEDHEVMVDRLQYRFENGFVDVGDLPCRKAFWDSMANRTVDFQARKPTGHIYYANGSRKVDFSGFIHVPTCRQYWAESVLTVEAAGDYEFRLATCGGVRLWVDGLPVCSFTPFDRNVEHTTTITLPLKAGANAIVIHTEELFERDTQFYFELTYLGHNPVSVTLPGITTSDLMTLESFVAQLAFDMNVTRHELHLDSELPVEEGVSVVGRVSGMSNEEETDEPVARQLLQPDSPYHIALPPALQPAHYAVALTFEWRSLMITRVFGINIMPEGKAAALATLAERKRDALQYTAHFGMNISGKMLAMLELGVNPETAATVLERSLQKISAREDCSDFWMVSVLWAWKKYHHTQLPDKLWDRTRSSILGYRYWLDEPGNDAMWFWSENHVLCFHVSQLLAGQYFPRDTFLCSGRTGRQQQEIATQRLNRWFEQILEHGLTEWNSSCYYPIDYIGLIALYELAESEQIREKARIVIDRLMLMSALHYQQGVAGGTMGRVYEKELMANEMTELAGFGNVAWGGGWHTRMCASLPMFCLSGYEPTPLSNEVATLKQRDTVDAYYTQGMNRGAKVVAWKQPGVMLSSVVDHRTGHKGHQQHVVDIQFAHHPKARIWINHPGEDVPGGDGRPSYWAGNGVLPRVMQQRNRALMIYRLNEDAPLAYTHVYLPTESLDEVVIREHWCFVRSGHAYAVIGAAQPLELVNTGVTRGRELRSQGRVNSWYVHVGELTQLTDFDSLPVRWAETRLVLETANERCEASMMDPDGNMLSLDWQGQGRINQEPWTFPSDAGVDPIIK